MTDPDPNQPSSKPIPIPSFRPSQVFRRRSAAVGATESPASEATDPGKRRRSHSA